MAQVRLSPEVEQWLLQRTIESGRSLASEADAWLRKAAQLPPGQHSPAARNAAKVHPSPVPPPPTRTAVITPPQGQGAIGRPLRRAGWQGAPR